MDDEKMEYEDAKYRVFVPLYDEYRQYVKNEVGESSIFTRNSQITKLLEFCVQPKTKNDTEAILVDFWDKFGKSDDLKRGIAGDWGEIVASSIFSLDYVYNKTDASLSSVKRSLYIENEVRALYRKRSLFRACNFYVWKLLRRNTDFDSFQRRGKVRITNALIQICMNGNLGLLKFMVKFGLIEFAYEYPEEVRGILFYLIIQFRFYINKTSLEPADLVNLIKHSGISFRRSLLIFFSLYLISKYKKHQKYYEMNSSVEPRLQNCLCSLDILTSVTTETKVTLKDIDMAITALNPFIGEDVGRSLKETSKKIFSETHYNPRSLKDLTRCKIRTCLRGSTTLPQQAYELPIPSALKEFLLFDKGGIWGLLWSSFYE